MTHSNRANRVWLRLEQMFGDDLRMAYPSGMTEAMAQVVDRVDDETVKDGLARIKLMRRPPNLREFSEALSSTPAPQARPNLMPALVAYATKHLNLTARQLRDPWTWVYEGDPRPGSQYFGIRGVRIPADNDEGRAEIILPVDVLHV